MKRHDLTEISKKIQIFKNCQNVGQVMSPHHYDQMSQGQKSHGSLCSVVETLIVSGAGPTKRRTKQGTRSPIELFWTAKKTEYKDV